MADHPFGTVQRRILDRVNAGGIVDLRNVADDLGCMRPSASRAVRSLVRRGAIEAVPFDLEVERGVHVRFVRRRS